MKRKIFSIAAVYLVTCGFLAFGQATSGQDILQRGMQEYQSSQYDAALLDFRNIILNPSYASVQGDAYFWIALSYMALGRLDDAQKNLEFFLQNYHDNPNIPEATYQKGRLLYLQNSYDKAIQVLYAFIQSFPNNPFVANAYYWIGESLYSLGHYDEAQKVFLLVVNQYPTSYKVETARYKISLIDMKNREAELLKLLKWSHEEALSAQEDFDQRQSAYEQALLAYQRRLAEMAKVQQSATAGAPATPSSADQIAQLNQQVAQLEEQIKTLVARLSTPGSAAGTATAAAPAAPTVQPTTGKEALLSLKQQALDLESFYYQWLASHPESAK